MTLCIVWRDGSNIKFVSDSRLSFGRAGSSDFGIKVARIPFNIYGSDGPGSVTPLLFSGELGMTFAGSAVGALMVKEALAEVIFSLQVFPFDDFGMDAISDYMFRAYRVISRDLCATILEQGRTCIVFAGFCATHQKLRAFRMETDAKNLTHKFEVLTQDGDMEILGSGENTARSLMPKEARERDVIDVLQCVIDDSSVPDVGGNIQYGSFVGSKFQPAGIAKLGAQNELGDREAHYWRGSLDLNGSDLVQPEGLIPNFPMLDLIG
jgi:hypothetical protein